MLPLTDGEAEDKGVEDKHGVGDGQGHEAGGQTADQQRAIVEHQADPGPQVSDDPADQARHHVAHADGGGQEGGLRGSEP